MAWQNMSESEWREIFYRSLDAHRGVDFSFVTGPGRSGAVAAVYASHYLGLPFKPHKSGNYERDKSVLIVDTVEYSGATIRKARSWYQRRGLHTITAYGVKEMRYIVMYIYY